MRGQVVFVGGNFEPNFEFSANDPGEMQILERGKQLHCVKYRDKLTPSQVEAACSAEQDINYFGRRWWGSAMTSIGNEITRKETLETRT